jgi:hypothetical protein
VLHVHGSDVRSTLNTKWGWIVKNNPLKAKTVLFSTEDLAPIVKDFRLDATNLPNPVDSLRLGVNVKSFVVFDGLQIVS